MADTPTLDAPPIADATLDAPPPPDISAASNYAILVITMLGPSFTFPTKDVPLNPVNFAINLAVIVAALVILTEVSSFLVVLNKYLSHMIEVLKIVAIAITMFILVGAFGLFTLHKSNYDFSEIQVSMLINNGILLVPAAGLIVSVCCRQTFIFCYLLVDLKDKFVFYGKKLADNFAGAAQWIWNARFYIILSSIFLLIAIAAAVLILLEHLVVAVILVCSAMAVVVMCLAIYIILLLLNHPR